MIGGRSALLGAAGGLGYGNWTGNYSDVSLLLRGGVPSTTLDESPTPKTITAVGNAVISTTTFKYGDSSLAFDGTGDYLSIPQNTAFDFGTGDFTVECWVNLNTLATDQSFVSYAAGTSGSVTSFSLDRLSTGAFRVFVYSGTTPYSATVSPSISTGTWYHVAGVRNGGQLRCYVNGVGGTAVSASVTVNATAGRILTVGSLHTSLRFVNGFIDDLRITKGIARYTANFTPPAAELPANITDDLSYNSVSLLIRGYTVAGPLVPGDESPTPKALTSSGTASVTTTAGQWKYSGSALSLAASSYFQFGGTNDPAFDFDSGDFTIEAWVYPTATSGTNAVVGNITGPFAGEGWYISIQNAALRFATVNSSSNATINAIGGTVPLNTYSHIAVTRAGTVLCGFINGQQVWQQSLTGNLITTNGYAKLLRVGLLAYSGAVYDYSGFIDDLRITKGIARYTKNFLPPPAQLPAI